MTNEQQMEIRSRFLAHTMWAELEKISAVTPKGLLMHAQRATSQGRKSQKALGWRRFIPGTKEWSASSAVKSRRKKTVSKLQGKLTKREKELTKAVGKGSHQGRATSELKRVREAQSGFGWFKKTKKPEGGTPSLRRIEREGTSKKPRHIGKTPETPEPKKDKKGLGRRVMKLVKDDPTAALGVTAGGTAAALASGVAGKKYLEGRQAQQYSY